MKVGVVWVEDRVLELAENSSPVGLTDEVEMDLWWQMTVIPTQDPVWNQAWKLTGDGSVSLWGSSVED